MSGNDDEFDTFAFGQRRQGAIMLKHRGFPSRLSGTDHQFTLRRQNKSGATPLQERKRHPDRKPADKRADTAFLVALLEAFGDQPFERGNLDAGRINWLFGREVVPAQDPFDPASYDAFLRVDLAAVRRGFPDVLDNFDVVEDETGDNDGEDWA